MKTNDVQRVARRPLACAFLLMAVRAFGQSAPPPFVQNLPGQQKPVPAAAAPQTAAAPARTSAGPVSVTIERAADGTFNVTAEQQDAIGVLEQFTAAADASVAFVGNASGTATVRLRSAKAADAIRLIARSAGLVAKPSDGGWIIGAPADVAAASAPAPGQQTQAVFKCEHLNAVTLVTTLQAAFDPQQLKVILGPAYLSPTLTSGASTYAVSNDQGSTITALGESDVNLRTHEILLVGDADAVKRGLALARRFDHHRAQVRIKVKISDVSRDALRNLGVQWDFGHYTLAENSNAQQTTASGTQPVVNGIKFGKFVHLPMQIDATITALEAKGEAKLLAEPSLSLLDGERSFILIGTRELFPKLVTSYYGAPTYDVQEVRVGIYIQVAAQIGFDDDVVLTVYPQVSLVADHLNVNGGAYPIIDTREEQTTIRAKSGEVVVIGGLLRDDDLKRLSRVPLLGRIPIFGELFKFRERSKVQTELVVTLTPQVERPELPPAGPDVDGN